MAKTAPSFESLRAEYARLWATMEVRPEKAGSADAAARGIVAAKSRYAAVEAETGVPWFVVGIIHTMECSRSFKLHLHNGDPLTARTFQVPAGRPVTGSPPFPWEVSAIDAIRYDGLHRVKSWTVERVAYELEKYNGWGHRWHHPDVLTPYLWSYTTHYRSGKYVKDRKWSQSAVSGQCGAMAILKRLMLMDPSIRAALSKASDGPAPLAKFEVEAIQKRLRDLGIAEVGFVDGKWGSSTTGGVSAFQAWQGLPVTGTYDDATRVRLADPSLKPRPVSPERAATTVEDLRERGSTTVKAADKGRGIAGLLALFGLGGGAAKVDEQVGVIDGAQAVLDQASSVRPIVDGFRDLLGWVGSAWWIFALVGAYLLWRNYGDIIERRLAGQISGRYR
ncbi:peptidoglycan-binding protein [Xanthobacter autotrophicus]|uniref:peptidoglycan-binding protein n=1 Tax=Xanthobacter autotrophicus TaxID=280 RepID=UPI00372B71E2